jgi:hypothetical protein
MRSRLGLMLGLAAMLALALAGCGGAPASDMVVRQSPMEALAGMLEKEYAAQCGAVS